MRICIITPAYRWGDGAVYLAQLIQILEPMADSIHVITGSTSEAFKLMLNKNIYVVNIEHHSANNMAMKLCKYIVSQLRISRELLKVSNQIDTAVFFFGSSLIIPMLTAKVAQIKVLLIVTGSISESVKWIYKGRGGHIFYYVARMNEKINYFLCDRIGIMLMSCQSSIRSLGLDHYKGKIVPFPIVVLDKKQFNIGNRLCDRGHIIGYVGRLSREKGVLQLARAIPLMLSRKSDLSFIIVGTGPLMYEMKQILEKSGCLDKVQFTGWVPHEEVAVYMHKLRFHVLPSYTENFGGAGLEAMACGAISVANAVGGLPDVIVDGETGFLLKDNEPQTIADKILEVWDNPDLCKIQNAANVFVEKNLLCEKVVENSLQMLAKMDSTAMRKGSRTN